MPEQLFGMSYLVFRIGRHFVYSVISMLVGSSSHHGLGSKPGPTKPGPA